MIPNRLIALAALLAALILPTAAQAQDYCDDLRARLGQSRGGGDDEAILRQLAEARRAASYEGCGRGLFGGGLFGRNSGYCGRINADIARLERRLGRRDRGPSRGEVAFIRRQMEEAGCNRPSQPREQRAANWGPYRTLCVRSCDGYYFPISAAANRSDLDTHARACQAACPDQQVSLFYQPVGEDDIKDAVSLDGRTYSSLPTAFAYRSEYKPSCGCAPAGGWASMAARFGISSTSGGGPRVAARNGNEIPVPVPKPVPGEDPETIANRNGDLVPEGVEGDPALVATVEPEIRRVGPAYVYHW